MSFIKDFRYTRRLFWQKNVPVLVFLLLILIMGVSAGALAVQSLEYGVRADLIHYLVAFLDGFDEDKEWRGQGNLWTVLMAHGQVLLLLWVLGLTIIGLPFIPLLLFLRGFVLGFTMGFIVHELGAAGFVFALASLVAQNLFFLPALVMAALFSIAFTWNVSTSLLQRRAIDFWQQLLGYSVLMMCCLVAFLVAGFMEYYVAPVLMDLTSKLVMTG